MEGPLAALKVSGRLGNAGGFTGGTGTLSEVHFAAEDCVVFNGEAEGADVALDRAAGTQLDAAGGHHIALHAALDKDVLGCEIGGDIGAGADGEAVFREADGAFHAAIDNEVFTALHFTVDDDGFADARGGVFHWHNF